MSEAQPKSPSTPVKAEVAPSIPTCELTELLEEVPLHSPHRVLMLFQQPDFGTLSIPPNIYVHCDNPTCEGIRRHWKSKDDRFSLNDRIFYYHLVYTCSNCTALVKIFTLRVERKAINEFSGVCTKVYQEPPFGSPVPKRLFQIIGETNREFFLQARRAIARGLGIGAYSYYRRIVENTKFDLVSSVLEVAQATNASSAQVELLKKAQAENQFSKAIEMLRDVNAIPAVLLIEGHNPLALLHDLLSEGIHKLGDAQCLERSKEAEVVLFEIAHRMQIAMTERKAVKAAISSILKRKSAGETSITAG